MHRSGTSVVAGLVDRLGLDGGPRDSMLSADQFNNDGYWEQRPLVDWHDEVLKAQRGWASAPPPLPGAHERSELLKRFGHGPGALVGGMYQDQWFMKDPRQCLLLWLWTEVRGDQDLAVVVFREAEGVARSLGTRNGYSPELAVALWERYCHDLLLSLSGRPCLILQYRGLTTDPDRWVPELATALDRHLDAEGDAFVSRVEEALPLVRRDHGAGDARDGLVLAPEQAAIAEVIGDITGYHERFELPVGLPSLSERGTSVLERRRKRLNRLRSVVRSSELRAKLDRIPAMLRYPRRS